MRGAIYDVALDLRADSETYCQWFGTELNSKNGRALLIPAGCAHGFLSLADNSEVHYLMSGRYDPDAASGVRYDDPAFAIDWPIPISFIATKDRNWSDFERQSNSESETE